MLQDPFTMLNPLMKSGRHIAEVLRDRPEFRGRAAFDAEVARRLGEVGITDPDVAERMPFQLSGGMSQRVALAAALASDPELLIADEPSTALDVTTQAEIIKLLKRVQQARGMSLVLITHNLRLFASGRPAVDSLEIPESKAFRDWWHEHAAARDWDALFDYRRQAPHAAYMHPTDEHLLPWFVAAGAGGRVDPPQRLHDALTYGCVGMDAYAFGPAAGALAAHIGAPRSTG